MSPMRFFRLYGKGLGGRKAHDTKMALSSRKAYATRRIDFLVEIVAYWRRVSGRRFRLAFETHQD